MRYDTAYPIGQGSMGEVLRAWDPTLERHVALKLLQSDDPEMAERMLREARAQARVHHPNICEVYEVGEIDKRPYIAMQYIDGTTLDEAAASLSLEQKLALVKTVAEAVQEAHRVGLIHRDLKPGNILVEEKDDGSIVPYVVDFGIVHEHEAPGLTLTGQVLGTPGYMSPEQARGEVHTLDRRSDVWSLGVVLYELLTGDVPFQGHNSIQVMICILQDEPPRLRRRVQNLPAELEAITLKCLEKDPDQRYGSAVALARDLGRYLDGETTEARLPGPFERLAKKLQQHRVASALVGAAAMLVLLLGVISVQTRRDAAQKAQLAQRFGRQVEHMDALMRFAHLSPLHDVSVERRQVRTAMDRIREEMGNLGDLAQGPGHFALGRGHLVLGRAREALGHLETAWESGFRTADTALALGRAYSDLYQTALDRAHQLRDAEAREIALERARADFREPSLRFLKASREEGTDRASYVEGLIAFSEEDYERALAKARETAAEQIWFYEARMLEADVYLHVGREAYWESDLERAAHDLAAAREAYASAFERGRSDPDVAFGLCRAWKYTVDLEIDTDGTPPHESMAATQAACEQVLLADPGNTLANEMLSKGWWRLGQARLRRGLDPGEALEASIRTAEAGLESSPDDVELLRSLGTAWLLRAQWENEFFRHRGGVEKAFTHAIEHLRRAADLEEGYAHAAMVLGNAHQMYGAYLEDVGRDPMPSYEEARHAYEEALRRPIRAETRIYSSLGALLNGIAYTKYLAGEDPTAELDRSVEVLTRAGERLPHLTPHHNLGMAHWTRADYERDTGQDPRSSYQRAVASFRNVLGRDSGYNWARSALVHVTHAEAEYQLGQGEDPRVLLERAEAENLHLRENVAIDHYYHQGKIELLRARFKAQNGGDPTAFFVAALAAARRRVELSPAEVLSHEIEVEVCRFWVDWDLRTSASPSGKIRSRVQAGLAAARRGLEANPRSAPVLVHQASLLRAAARLTGDEDERRRQLAAADEALRRAVELQPLLNDPLLQ